MRLCIATLGTGISEALITEWSGLGGILLLALGLDLLDIRKFPLLDLSWSLALLPLILHLFDITGFPG